MSSKDLPGFEILEKIGTGGMATVWKARQISLDRTVAIKILNPNFTAQSDDIKRFQREAQSAAKLKHPGIVQVYDANAIDGVYFFVMEYVSGYTVGEWIKRKGQLRESNALLVAACVAEALKYAWESQKMIHCDIKPDNVLVDADGTVKVSDLGLSRTLSTMLRSEVQSDEVMGTPYYISPEQALGHVDLDFRADIYSLGAMLFHMLTGRMPFQDEDAERVMEKQVTDALPLVSELNPNVSSATAALVKKMLEKNPDNRYLNWQAVMDDIEAAKAGRPSPGKGGASKSGHAPDAAKIRKRRAQISRIQGKSEHSFMRVLLVLVGCAAVLLFLNTVFKNTANPPNKTRVTVPPPSVGSAPKASGSDTVLEKTFEPTPEVDLREARTWAAENPHAFDEAIRRFSAIVDGGGSQEVVRIAAAEIQKIERQREREVMRVMETLKSMAEQHEQQALFEEAAGVFENYNGPFVDLTAKERQALAGALRAKAASVVPPDPESAAIPSLDGESVLDEVVTQILALNSDGACRVMSSALWNLKDETQRKTFEEIFDVLKDGTSGDSQIRRSFISQVGQKISVELQDGVAEFVVRAVRDDRICVVRPEDAAKAGAQARMIQVDELSYKEKLRRLSTDNAEGKALAIGLMALEANAYTYAVRSFADTHEALSTRLIERLRARD